MIHILFEGNWENAFLSQEKLYVKGQLTPK